MVDAGNNSESAQTEHALDVGRREQDELNGVDDDDEDDEQIQRSRRRQRVHRGVESTDDRHRRTFSVLQADRRYLRTPNIIGPQVRQ